MRKRCRKEEDLVVVDEGGVDVDAVFAEDGVVVVAFTEEGIEEEGILLDQSFASSGASTLGLNNPGAREEEEEAGRSGGCFESEVGGAIT